MNLCVTVSALFAGKIAHLSHYFYKVNRVGVMIFFLLFSVITMPHQTRALAMERDQWLNHPSIVPYPFFPHVSF